MARDASAAVATMVISVPMVASGPPTALQLKMKPALVVLVTCQAVLAIGRFLVADVFGGISDLLLALIGYFVCTEPSITYTIWYGMLCCFNGLFDLLHIVMRLRRLKGGYFDVEEGFFHNAHSFVLLAAAVTAFLGGAVCYYIWRDFRSQSPGAGLTSQMNQSVYYDSMPPPGAYYNTYSTMGQQPPVVASPPDTGHFEAFSGPGHKIGEKDDEFLPPPPRTGPAPTRTKPPDSTTI